MDTHPKTYWLTKLIVLLGVVLLGLVIIAELFDGLNFELAQNLGFCIYICG